MGKIWRISDNGKVIIVKETRIPLSEIEWIDEERPWYAFIMFIPILILFAMGIASYIAQQTDNVILLTVVILILSYVNNNAYQLKITTSKEGENMMRIFKFNALFGKELKELKELTTLIQNYQINNKE